MSQCKFIAERLESIRPPPHAEPIIYGFKFYGFQVSPNEYAWHLLVQEYIQTWVHLFIQN